MIVLSLWTYRSGIVPQCKSIKTLENCHQLQTESKESWDTAESLEFVRYPFIHCSQLLSTFRPMLAKMSRDGSSSIQKMCTTLPGEHKDCSGFWNFWLWTECDQWRPCSSWSARARIPCWNRPTLAQIMLDMWIVSPKITTSVWNTGTTLLVISQSWCEMVDSSNATFFSLS